MPEARRQPGLAAQLAEERERLRDALPHLRQEGRGKLVKLFQECKFPPKKKLIGNAQVRIVVDELGKVVNREIVKSSGDAKVDQAALANVDYALSDCKDEGLPQAPQGLTATDRTVIQGYNFK